MKWLLPEAEMTAIIDHTNRIHGYSDAAEPVDSIPLDAGDYIDAAYDITVGGEVELYIKRPRGWCTPEPCDERRQTWLVYGERLGGYVGLSRGADGWHIGTPTEVLSPVLIDLAARRGWRAL